MKIADLINNPAKIGAVAVVVATTVLGSGNVVLDKFTSFLQSNQKSASASQKSCFEKVQDLETGVKQGVTVCFKGSLENYQLEYFSLSPNGVRTNTLIDEQKFLEYMQIQDLSPEVQKADQTMPQQVKGANNLKTQQKNLSEEIKKDIVDNFD